MTQAHGQVDPARHKTCGVSDAAHTACVILNTAADGAIAACRPHLFIEMGAEIPSPAQPSASQLRLQRMRRSSHLWRHRRAWEQLRYTHTFCMRAEGEGLTEVEILCSRKRVYPAINVKNSSTICTVIGTLSLSLLVNYALVS